MPEVVRLLVVSAAEVPPGDGFLGERERERLAAMAVPARRDSFRLGRYAAARLLGAELRLPEADWRRIDVVAAADGAPEPFLDGRPLALALSISHAGGAGACAVGPAGLGLGVDVEVVAERSAAFVADWFTAVERERITGASEPKLAANLAWSAKESALKALRCGLRRDTRELEVRWSPPDAGWAPLEVRVDGAALPGWWQRRGDLVLTCVGAALAGGPPSARR